MEKTKEWLVDIIIYLFIALFVYTAYSKIVTYESFQKVLARSVLIGHYSSFIAWFIPAIEIVISILLAWPRLKKVGLVITLGLMILFTSYLIYMINSGSTLSCQCGGIVSALSWSQHIWLNISFIVLAIVGLMFYKTESEAKEVLHTIKKIIAMKKVIFSLLIAGIAMGTSAFTSASKLIVGETYVQDPSRPGIYVKLDDPYDPDTFCQNITLEPCAFIQTSSEVLPDEIELTDLENNPDFTESTVRGAYTGL